MDNNRVAKISAVIQFIETHLTEKLDLNRVATAVHYSKYHLHGDAPAMIPCSDKEDEIAKVKVTLDAFLQSGNTSLGIILKTNSSALVFHKLLAEDYQIQLISPDSTSFTNGISVTSIQMSKGLEFDEVIIPNANSDTYQCDDDRSLLYIAATRAMHHLTLLYWGEPSRFLPRP